jgi:hypothetical protein
MGPATWLRMPPGSAAGASCAGGQAGRLSGRHLRRLVQAMHPVLRAHRLLQNQDAGIGPGHSRRESLLPSLQAGGGRGPAAATTRHQAISGQSASCLSTGRGAMGGPGTCRSLRDGDGRRGLAGACPLHRVWWMLGWVPHAAHGPQSSVQAPHKFAAGGFRPD